jgi:hypothetical protein
MRRRTVMGSVVGVATGLLTATFPVALEDGRLDATVSVLSVSIADRVEAISVGIENNTDRPVTPVPFVHSQSRGPATWDFADGQPTIPAGRTGVVTLSPPRKDEALSLPVTEQCTVRVFELGTDNRARTTFVPADVPEAVA